MVPRKSPNGISFLLNTYYTSIPHYHDSNITEKICTSLLNYNHILYWYTYKNEVTISDYYLM